MRGKKVLFLDKTLSGPIDLFAKFSLLQVGHPANCPSIEVVLTNGLNLALYTSSQDFGVDKLFWLDEPVTEHPQKNVIYLARCTVKNAYTIASKRFSYHLVGRKVSGIDHI